jgi:quinol-cytochrome oxidoreductase complex cytochrome b subunit
VMMIMVVVVVVVVLLSYNYDDQSELKRNSADSLQCRKSN